MAHLPLFTTTLLWQAEPQFLEAAGKFFTIETVGSDELDEVYQTADVDVLRLRLLEARGPSEAAGGCLLPQETGEICVCGCSSGLVHCQVSGIFSSMCIS